LNLIRFVPAKGQDIVNTSIFLAKLIGPVALVVGAALFLNKDGFRAMAEEFLRSRPLIYLSGLLSMTGGLAIVLTHNVWVANWPVIVTALGWLAAIGGALRILIPDKVEGWGRSMIRHPMGMMIAGAIWLAFGAVLCFFGYATGLR
jgi:hypothetical protein